MCRPCGACRSGEKGSDGLCAACAPVRVFERGIDRVREMTVEIVEKMWKERKWFGINDDLVGRRPKGGWLVRGIVDHVSLS